MAARTVFYIFINFFALWYQSAASRRRERACAPLRPIPNTHIIMRVRVYQLFIECAHVLAHIQRKGLSLSLHALSLV